MNTNNPIRHPGQSEAAIRDPEVSMSYLIPDKGCAGSGMTLTSLAGQQ